MTSTERTQGYIDELAKLSPTCVMYALAWLAYRNHERPMPDYADYRVGAWAAELVRAEIDQRVWRL